MLRVRRKQNKGPPRAEFHGRTLAGLAEVAFLVASSENALPPEQVESLAEILVHFSHDTANLGELLVLLETCEEALEREGYDARISAILQLLPTHELRRVAALGGAVVLVSREPHHLPTEGEMFISLASALGMPREEALHLLDEAQKLVEHT